MKINLEIFTVYDLELLEENISCRLIRIIGKVRFATNNRLSKEFRAIIGTGSPVPLIPLSIWQEIKPEYLSDKEFPISGIASKEAEPISAKIAKVKLLFIDPATVSKFIEVKAYLLPTDHIPLIIGFEDLLTECKLFCNYKNNTAYLEF